MARSRNQPGTCWRWLSRKPVSLRAAAASWRRWTGPLEHKGDTIARWTVIKNRGGQAGGEVWSLYRRHLHTYLPLLKEDGADQKEASRGW